MLHLDAFAQHSLGQTKSELNLYLASDYQSLKRGQKSVFSSNKQTNITSQHPIPKCTDKLNKMILARP